MLTTLRPLSARLVTSRRRCAAGENQRIGDPHGVHSLSPGEAVIIARKTTAISRAAIINARATSGGTLRRVPEALFEVRRLKSSKAISKPPGFASRLTISGCPQKDTRSRCAFTLVLCTGPQGPMRAAAQLEETACSTSTHRFLPRYDWSAMAAPHVSDGAVVAQFVNPPLPPLLGRSGVQGRRRKEETNFLAFL